MVPERSVQSGLSRSLRLNMAENEQNIAHLHNGIGEDGPKSASQMTEEELKSQVAKLKPELIKHSRKSLMKGDTW